MENPISALVQAADSISGARPGARRESGGRIHQTIREAGKHCEIIQWCN